MARLEGKVVLISGAASGMGAAHARAMVREGAKVVLGDIADAAGEALATELGDASCFVHLDVTRAQHWKAAVETAVSRFGRLNVVVNNAGMVNGGPLGQFSEDEWQQVLAVNLTGPFLGMSAAIDELKRSAPSSIINISSIAGLQGMAGLHGYTSSKFGLRGLTKSAALELARTGVRVNSVHPGGVRTAMTAAFPDEAATAPMGRWGQVDEVTGIVLHLASDESTFTTGAEYSVDGGECAGVVHDLGEHLD
ncbi:3-alpha-hydroxysteroid dehydrogenase [Croceicoccus estronivorus]|uniref:glucose 1-dehydrogenase n=1 Tax=Croceicoccus estronivorus TaxID=1172626 RepID=UPI00082A461A|nr:glucose 1-dehydrogenase [Croceicoccus estronivorus]OCC23744.1 3-alpha-hydroxysteroid dehydrogenase [Croceicoccus estronivorus]